MTVGSALHQNKNYVVLVTTYTEDEFLKYKQDIELQSTFQQDQNLISFGDGILNTATNLSFATIVAWRAGNIGWSSGMENSIFW